MRSPNNRHRNPRRVALRNDPPLLIRRPEPAHPSPHRSPLRWCPPTDGGHQRPPEPHKRLRLRTNPTQGRSVRWRPGFLPTITHGLRYSLNGFTDSPDVARRYLDVAYVVLMPTWYQYIGTQPGGAGAHRKRTSREPQQRSETTVARVSRPMRSPGRNCIRTEARSSAPWATSPSP